MELKFATYNIHACIGVDRVFDPHRIIAVIQELDADIIALQEVEHHLLNDIELLEFIGNQTGMYRIAGPTMFRESRHYGNAVLSKHPFTSFELIDLSHGTFEPRGAVQCRLTINNHALLVMATHFGLKPIERNFQASESLRLLQQPNADLTVLMGDLNEWFLWGQTVRGLKRYFGHTPSRKTFPSWLPIFSLDRIWVHPRKHLISLKVHKTALSKQASDHLPLIAQILI